MWWKQWKRWSVESVNLRLVSGEERQDEKALLSMKGMS